MMDEKSIFKQFRQAVADGRIPKDHKIFEEVFNEQFEKIKRSKMFGGGSRVLDDHQYSYCTLDDIAWSLARYNSRLILLQKYCG